MLENIPNNEEWLKKITDKLNKDIKNDNELNISEKINEIYQLTEDLILSQNIKFNELFEIAKLKKEGIENPGKKLSFDASLNSIKKVFQENFDLQDYKDTYKRVVNELSVLLYNYNKKQLKIFLSKMENSLDYKKKLSDKYINTLKSMIDKV